MVVFLQANSRTGFGTIMSDTHNRIRFPVIRALEVIDYDLYPGVGGQGLVHSFDPGVSVIVGVNGLGKTTLLNILLRVLIGPWDPPREDPEEVGSTRHELISWRTADFFSSRVPNGATHAFVSATITFGEEKVRIKRRLKDLSISELWLGDRRLSPEAATLNDADYVSAMDKVYQSLAVSLSGVSDFYDFRFIVRNLLFYLEDRRPLIWADRGQFEVARILFMDPSASMELAKLSDEVRQLDTNYRGLRYEITTKRRRLEQARRELAKQVVPDLDPAAIEDALAGTEESLADVDNLLRHRIAREQEVAEKIRVTQIDSEGKQRAYEELQLTYYLNAFPRAEESFKYILSQIISASRCLVCGGDAHDRAAHLIEEMKHGVCPVCLSPPEGQENGVLSDALSKAQIESKKVNDAGTKAAEARALVAQLSTERQQLANQISQLAAQRELLRLERERLRGRQSALAGSKSASPAVIRDLEAALAVDNAHLRHLDQERTNASKKFKEAFSRAKGHLNLAFSQTKQYFEEYVRAFVAEPCSLDVATVTEPLGQGGPAVEQPRIRVSMRSAAHGKVTMRSRREQLSESQGEFVDLAFRLALIRAASATEGAMLVLETPEASLDSLFVYSAGDVLRDFSAEGGRNGNVVIASSNLNDSPMIPALLGIDRQPPSDPKWKEKRLVNLLNIAVRTLALEQFEPEYRRRFLKATTPDPNRAAPRIGRSI